MDNLMALSCQLTCEIVNDKMLFNASQENKEQFDIIHDALSMDHGHAYDEEFVTVIIRKKIFGG